MLFASTHPIFSQALPVPGDLLGYGLFGMVGMKQMSKASRIRMYTGERAWLSVGRMGLTSGETLKAEALSPCEKTFFRTVGYHSAWEYGR